MQRNTNRTKKRICKGIEIELGREYAEEYE
jgi:hypothetical protein